MNERLKQCHLDRAAYIYVRQSSMQQVHHNLESQRRQYGLQDHASQLGFRQTVVIDDDLGRSGSGLVARPGFARLVAAVCESKVGAVFALEASRLARNNHDWHHLLELCVLTQTLVVDHDGIYDPSILNDRLLLGLKGTMSEFELGLLRQRAQEALFAKARRGEVVTCVPAGYVKARDGRIEMTADRQVQESIRGVFRKFHELGSARQVLLWYRQEKLPLPRQGNGEDVSWSLPCYNRILAILSNPIYAGAYAYGKTCSRTKVVGGRARKTAGHSVARDTWKVLIRDHHEAYISWDEYESINNSLGDNAYMRGLLNRGAAKQGKALLAGLLRCKRCGRKLHVAYSGNQGRVARYHCRGANVNHGTAMCFSVGALRIDRALEAVVLDVLRPEAVAASYESARAASRAMDERIRSVSLAVERANYEADRARRQYDCVDPSNRLVAAELEQRWNRELAKLEELKARLAAMPAEVSELSQSEKTRLLQLGQDVGQLWRHPLASASLKKRIVRSLMEEIVIDVVEGDPPQVVLLAHWKGGTHSELRVRKNATGQHGRSTDRETVDLVRELSNVIPDRRIAWNLNRLGCSTGTGMRWTEQRVRSLRNQHKIRAFDPGGRNWLTLTETARELKVSNTVVRRLLDTKALKGRRVAEFAPWIIERSDLEEPAVQQAVKAAHRASRGQRTAPGQTQLFEDQ
jgi:DNA invertase Pin-like site-specific DNA recombinase